MVAVFDLRKFTNVELVEEYCNTSTTAGFGEKRLKEVRKLPVEWASRRPYRIPDWQKLEKRFDKHFPESNYLNR